ncbi:hypothetical protein OUZ56_022699 [Daphnia magna]|uniref:Uncharacterized protein n=1 Tax=Daphnia magna TaxID=35525 RepID=A0ABR0AX66_9CRUS|nr:hypothetical protein OUZ56_022699 [Daphnia magna]
MLYGSLRLEKVEWLGFVNALSYSFPMSHLLLLLLHTIYGTSTSSSARTLPEPPPGVPDQSAGLLDLLKVE